MLDAQLQVFTAKFIGDKEIRLQDVIEKLKLLTHEERDLLSQVVILAIVVPATMIIKKPVLGALHPPLKIISMCMQVTCGYNPTINQALRTPPPTKH